MPNTYQVRLLKERLSGVLGVLVVIAALTLGSLGTNAQTYTDLHDFDPTSDAGFGLYDGMVAQGRDGNFYGTLPQGSFGASYGTVYKVTPSGTFTVLHTFTGTDGTTPYSGLTLGTDGNFYGTTFSGGTYGWGTIFKITPSGTFTTLHVFTGADGCAAYGPPVQGKGLVFYGVTQCLTAYSITPSGTFKLLPNTLPNGVYGTPILASDGNFYGTSFLGGNGNLGTVYRLTPSGVVTIIYSFDSTHGAEPIGPVVQGKDGNLYGVTAYGGTAANPGGVVFKMTLNGSISVLHNFDSKSNTDGANPYGGLVLGSDGNFYSGTFSGSSGTAAQYGNLYKITPSGVYSNLYDFDLTHGATVGTTPTQHTNGILYGESYRGGANGYGTFWELNAGLPPFVSIVGFPAGSSGATVEILGQGFTTASSVAFGSAAATFTVVSDTYLTAKVPSSGTTGPITVTTNGGTPTSKQSFRVLPVISGFSPATGPVGTQVTITGSGFIGTTAVAFNGVKASFTVNSATQITAIVPSGATTGAIAIRTAGGTAVSKTSFTVM